jgi:hypothetical protein
MKFIESHFCTRLIPNPNRLPSFTSFVIFLVVPDKSRDSRPKLVETTSVHHFQSDALHCSKSEK